MISVVMTTYNGEKYILKQLDSLMNQTRSIDELIICDDCSTDNTVLIIESYFEIHAVQHKLIKNEKNLGYIANFYQGMKFAQGDLLFLCDQDDIWMSSKIERMAELMDTHDITALNCGVRLIDSDDGVMKEYTENYDRFGLKEITLETLIHNNIGPGCAMCIRKEAVDYYLEHGKKKLPHDYELNLISVIIGKCFFYNEPLVNYRIHENNVIGLAIGRRKGNNAKMRVINSHSAYERMCFIKDMVLSNMKSIDIETQNALEREVVFAKKRIDFLETRKLKDLFYLFRNANLYTSRRPFVMDLFHYLHLERVIDYIYYRGRK